jgi:lysozyme family protein
VKDNWQRSLDLVLAHEGGFTNHHLDPGKVTNLGVTQRAWEAYVNRAVTEKEMMNLTRDIVCGMFKTRYWDACHCDDLPLGIDYAVFDFAVNAGIGRASKMLQTALGTAADGVIGKNTISLANNYDPDEFLEKFSKAKEQFYRGLQTFDTFGKGWIRRVSDVQQTAEGMIA